MAAMDRAGLVDQDVGLLLLGAAIVFVEAVSAVLTRRVFAQEFRLAPAGGRRP